jgi:hypothetical protein
MREARPKPWVKTMVVGPEWYRQKQMLSNRHAKFALLGLYSKKAFGTLTTIEKIESFNKVMTEFLEAEMRQSKAKRHKWYSWFARWPMLAEILTRDYASGDIAIKVKTFVLILTIF